MSNTPLPAWKLMLYGVIGIIIGLAIVLAGSRAIGVELPLGFEIFLVTVIAPLWLLYLWKHRSPDNTHFIIK